MALLVDAGILYAAADRRDAWHDRARSLLAGEREILLVPVTVLPEVCYLMHERLGSASERAFLRSVGSDLIIEPLLDGDVERSRELLERQPELGFVDATVVAIAERLQIRRIATTDRRHFGKLSPGPKARFELVP